MASRRRRNLRPAIALGSVLLLAGIVGGYMLWKGGPAAAEGSPETGLPGTGSERESLTINPREAESAPTLLASNTPPTVPVHLPVNMPPPAAATSPIATSPIGETKPPAAPVREAPAPEPKALRVVGDYPADLQGLIRAADQRIEAKDLVTARELLNRALRSDKATEEDRQSLRGRISKLNDGLVFSPTIDADDPLTEVYTVQSGDSLTRIVPRQGLAVETGFVARVNRMSNANNLRVGQKLKLVRGPFHAVITKSAFRLDLYSGNPGEESGWVYIRSCTVGLGEGDSTPVGTFVVRRHSKLVDPPWTNPRTGERFAAKDPKNPIGNRWLGLEGTGSAAAQSGYGIHGTIEPDSIGMMKSMGCIRLGQADVELVYDMLVEAISTVRIDP